MIEDIKDKLPYTKEVLTAVLNKIKGGIKNEKRRIEEYKEIGDVDDLKIAEVELDKLTKLKAIFEYDIKAYRGVGDMLDCEIFDHYSSKSDAIVHLYQMDEICDLELYIFKDIFQHNYSSKKASCIYWGSWQAGNMPKEKFRKMVKKWVELGWLELKDKQDESPNDYSDYITTFNGYLLKMDKSKASPTFPPKGS